MSTIRAIAEATNFSVATVSEALRNSGKVKEETRAIILKAAEQMGYRRNAIVGNVMSSIGKSHSTHSKGTIGILETESFHESRKNSRWHTDLFEGARNRCEQLGYGLEFFQFRQTVASLRRLQHILVSRGISGILLPPFANKREFIGFNWGGFSVVQLDYGLKGIALHTVLPDHHNSLVCSLRRLEGMGYRRPGLIVERFQDDRIFMKWYAAYKAFTAQSVLCEEVEVYEPDQLTREGFHMWFRRSRPDVIIGHRTEVIEWLDEVGLKVPADTGFFSLNLHHSKRLTAGLNLMPDQLGKAAVEVLSSLMQRNDRGIPKVPHTTSVEGLWTDGFSIRKME